MTTLLPLMLAFGAAPLAMGLAGLDRSPRGTWPRVRAASVILCALAFNLTFIWQELWLVIPKALTPGLHPILYHNNHDWTGSAPDVELLQGTGALATLASGLAFSVGLALARRLTGNWRLFLFWMAFQGLFQSLTQLAIGAMLPGNDVGRALGYLHVGQAARWALLALAGTAMAICGAFLARACPTGGDPRTTSLTRAFVLEMLLTAMLAIVLIVPFREPRDIVEVVVIPLFVNLVGVGWLALGAAIVRRGCGGAADDRSGVVGPALALGLCLLLFQFVLRGGIAF